MSEFVVPPALEPGDQVAVIAPSSGHAAAYPEVYDLGLDRLRDVFDLDPVEFPTATEDSEHLYDHPEERARDVEEAFADPEIRGVVATIGGWEQVRILNHLDPAVLRENPTRFYGHSDNGVLASVLWTEGVVSFYGGTLMTDLAMQGSMHEYTRRHLETAFFAEDLAAFGDLAPAERFTDEDLDWDDPATLDQHREMEPAPGWTFAGADRAVAGRLWGGCLGTIDAMLRVGRPLPEPADLDGEILLLETSEELPSAMGVRESLVCLGERGLLERFSGVIVGRAKARSPQEEPGPDEREAYRERQREAVSEVLSEYNPDAPVVFDVDVGHTAPVVPLPLGGEVAIDPADERISVRG